VPGGGSGKVAGERVIVCLVEVIEGREGKQSFGREGVDPVGDEEGIALGLSVAQAVGTVVVCRGTFVVVGVGVVGNVEVVLAILRVEAELIFGGLVANQVEKAALRVGCVVIDSRDRCGEAVVGAGAGEACVPGGLAGVVAEGELGLAGAEVAAGEQELALAVALEAVARKTLKTP
jgi:hypothetical protein